MTTTASPTEEISTEAVDRIVLAVDFAREQARSSAVVRTPAARRLRVLRLNRQARFLRTWGLR